MASASIADRFALQFGRDPDVIASAPGRVNLIGEHTDYNEGFALPMAIDRRVRVAVACRDGGPVVARSERFGETRELDVATHHSAGLWFDYVVAVLRALRDAGTDVPACDLLIDAGVPEGAGLSSSAALETALARALSELAGVSWDPVAAARIAQRAENEYVGVRCGIMDQLSSACARAGHAMLIDFRSLHVEHVRMPSGAAVVVMDTGVRRSLSASEYNERRAACERATTALQGSDRAIRALRDVDHALLAATVTGFPDDTARDCARHVVAENRRPERLRDALLARDFAAAGALMNESHDSLRDLYRVSSAHLDIACDIAREHDGCFGARMTGAGFGGCAIALVRSDAVSAFLADTLPRYESATYKRGEFYVVSPDDGARLERVQ